MKQFRRNAQVTIGIGKTALVLGELRFRFECVKNQFSNRMPNQLTLVIYNLKQDTRERLTEHAIAIRFEVGYGDVLRELFIGQVAHAVHVHEGSEWVTTLYCWDQYIEMRESVIKLSAVQGTNLRFILDQVVGSFGVIGYDYVGIEHLDAKTLLRPLELTGPSARAMDGLGRDFKFNWGFQDGRMEVTGIGPEAHFKDQAVVISQATGMIGHPIVTDLGIEVMTLLNPRIRVNRLIVVKSVGVGVRVGQIEIRKNIPTLKPGTYTVGEAVFNGDTWGPNWTTRIKSWRPGNNN